MAIKVYERMPASSPLKRNAQIQLATNLDAADRSDEAIKILKGVTAEDAEGHRSHHGARQHRARPQEVRRLRHDLFAGASTRCPALTDKNTWVTYYYRGICEERSKQWNKAEADMRKALELQPEQPHVLNYLGYSWIDQGINLDEGMKMIKRAVDQRPDDGYIVDSLGWAYLPDRQLRGRGEEARARDRPQARGSRPSTTISATPIGASAGRWKPNSSGPTPATSSPRRRNCRRSKPRSPTVCPKTPLPRLPPTRRRKTARAAERKEFRGCSAMPVLSR